MYIMKIDVTKTIIAFNLSIISVFLLRQFTNITKTLLLIIVFVAIFIPLFFALAYKYEQTDKDKQIKKLSYVFSMIMILSSIIFSILAFEELIYIMINSFSLLVFILLLYVICNNKERIKTK